MQTGLDPEGVQNEGVGLPAAAAAVVGPAQHQEESFAEDTQQCLPERNPFQQHSCLHRNGPTNAAGNSVTVFLTSGHTVKR